MRARDTEEEVTTSWQTIDRTLQGLARQRSALDAEEARWLRAAYRVRVWRHVGCVNMVDYMERFLGYGLRCAQDRLRLALALEALPATALALAAGELSYAAARTLLRVVTAGTEQQWLTHCAGMSVHQIENAVAGRGKGAAPSDPRQPELESRCLRYSDVRPSTVAMEREALAKARAAVRGELTDDQFLAMVFATFLESASDATGGSVCDDAADGRARYQVGVVVCEACDQGWREGAGRRFALDESELARARCDAQHLGPLDTDEPARAVQDVPPRVRRQVLRRDRRRCTIDGCRSAAHVEVHHIVAREDGGTHDAWNLTVVCGACHDNLHRGLITLTGTAPDALVITRRHRRATRACAASTAGDEQATTRAAAAASASEAAVAPESSAGRFDIDPRGSGHGEDCMAVERPARAIDRVASPNERDRPPAKVDARPLDRVDFAARDTSPATAARGPDRVEPSARFDRVTVDLEAKLALVTAGFRRGEAAAAVARARTQLDGEVDLERLLREALRRLAIRAAGA